MITIVVGLPSYNESDTIRRVTQDVDQGLQKLPYPHKAVIVNADNQSSDGTQEIFEQTETFYKKVALQTDKKGKGSNLVRIMEHSDLIQADVVLMIDSDLAEVPSTWIHSMINAVIKGYDAVFPCREPIWNGGDLNYHLAYPIISSVFGMNLRSLFSGEMCFSSKFVKHALQQTWSDIALHYGSDFFLASLAEQFNWCEVVTFPRRKNKLRSFSPDLDQGITMGQRFQGVLEIIQERVSERLKLPMPDELKTSCIGEISWKLTPVPAEDYEIEELRDSTYRYLSVNSSTYDILSENLTKKVQTLTHSKDNYHGMSWQQWQDCLFEWIYRFKSEQETPTVKQIEQLFLARVVAHHDENISNKDWYHSVEDQAKQMFIKRERMWA